MAAYSWRAAPAFIVVSFLAAGPALCYAQEVDFNRDIRPIFSDRCYACHGPDQANRKTKLRFDTEAGAKQDLGGAHFAVVPRDSANMLPSLRGSAQITRLSVCLWAVHRSMRTRLA